jgi:hypothetical protein
MIPISAAQVHLGLNHLPVFASLFALAALIFAAASGRIAARNFGLGMVVFAAVSALPAFFSGEGAEEIVEDRPGVSEARIETHEEAAESALYVLLAAGGLAAAALAAARFRPAAPVRAVAGLALLTTVAATGMMLQVAHLGGQIRHDEIRSPSTLEAPQRHD